MKDNNIFDDYENKIDQLISKYNINSKNGINNNKNINSEIPESIHLPIMKSKSMIITENIASSDTKLIQSNLLKEIENLKEYIHQNQDQLELKTNKYTNEIQALKTQLKNQEIYYEELLKKKKEEIIQLEKKEKSYKEVFDLLKSYISKNIKYVPNEKNSSLLLNFSSNILNVNLLFIKDIELFYTSLEYFIDKIYKENSELKYLNEILKNAATTTNNNNSDTQNSSSQNLLTENYNLKEKKLTDIINDLRMENSLLKTQMNKLIDKHKAMSSIPKPVDTFSITQNFLKRNYSSSKGIKAKSSSNTDLLNKTNTSLARNNSTKGKTLLSSTINLIPIKDFTINRVNNKAKRAYV